MSHRIGGQAHLVTPHNFDPILQSRKKRSKMDFVKMLLAIAASHLGGLALCALYAGLCQLRCETPSLFLTFSVLDIFTSLISSSSSHSAGSWHFSLHGGTSRIGEVDHFFTFLLREGKSSAKKRRTN